ncbi:DUF4184 family protein [Oryzobacter terrae]|uniref:DUF4184 family protein n=1 Tax=Oryzobacter terrae TaxID=1620385 RepID=UPI00366D7C99
MPITPAHVAAVLPVLGRRRSWVVPAAWVVGSMSPDLVYFAPVGNARAYSHSLVGLLTVDLVLGGLVLAAWWTVVGAAARDLLPEDARRRVSWPVVPRGRWGRVVLGLLGGSVTHVVWDSFTHRDGWGAAHVPGLRDAVWAGQPATSVLQDGSGVVGLVALAAWAAVRLREAPAVVEDAPVLTQAERWVARVLVVVVPVALCASITAAVAWDFTYLVNALFVGFTRAVALSSVLVVLAAVGWHLLRRRRCGTRTGDAALGRVTGSR